MLRKPYVYSVNRQIAVLRLISVSLFLYFLVLYAVDAIVI